MRIYLSGFLFAFLIALASCNRSLSAYKIKYVDSSIVIPEQKAMGNQEASLKLVDPRYRQHELKTYRTVEALHSAIGTRPRPFKKRRVVVDKFEHRSEFLKLNEKQEKSRNHENYFDNGTPDKKEEREVPLSRIGTIALIVTLFNLIFFMFFPFLGLATSLLAIVFAHKAKKVNDQKSKEYGKKSTSYSIFTLVIAGLMTLFFVFGNSIFGL